MKKFEFSSNPAKESTTFTGRTFYAVYKEAEFLRTTENVEMILARGYELRQSLKEVAPGDNIVLDKMCLERNTPLLVKNTSGANVAVEDFEFTYNRLTGLAAAYVFDNRHRFPVITASEASALGLVWNHEDEQACKLYLSAVSGTEHFYHFSFYPLLCALKKLQLKKITLPPVMKIAKIKNDDGERMATVLMKNWILTNELWNRFGGPAALKTNLKDLLTVAPPELKRIFLGNQK